MNVEQQLDNSNSLASIDKRLTVLEIQYGHIEDSLKKQDLGNESIKMQIKSIADNLASHTLDEQKNRVRLLSKLSLVLASVIGTLLSALATLGYTFMKLSSVVPTP